MSNYFNYCIKNNLLIKPKKLNNINILFADIIGFTTFVESETKNNNLSYVYNTMNTIFYNFDLIAQKNHVYKVETIGDCYMAMTNLYESDNIRMSQINILNFAFDLIDYLQNNLPYINIRIGIAYGDIIVGILGETDKRINFIGDSINLASRIQNISKSNNILVSDDFYKIFTSTLSKTNILYNFIIEKNVYIKGKGIMQCYLCQKNIDTSIKFLISIIEINNLVLKNFKKSVLIIDDSMIICKIMKKRLEQFNFNLFLCNSPDDYINNHLTYYYDAIIIDNNYHNSQIKGIELINYINKYTIICLFSSSKYIK
jgi:CheY-like chemotaxis protein